MKSIAIDMDNVIADVETHYINWYERDYGVRMSREQLIGIPETQAFPDKEAVKKFLFTPGFFRTVPIIEGAREAVEELMKSYKVYIVSAAMEFPQSLSEKYEWLKEHFPFISWHQIIFCGDKSVISTDFMIDDHVKNLDSCSGKPLLFSACHNAYIHHHQRLNNWKEVLDWFGKRNDDSEW
ncbi:MAG: 5' nucleotidase, NT5C type [Flavisolibacter sp.]